MYKALNIEANLYDQFKLFCVKRGLKMKDEGYDAIKHHMEKAGDAPLVTACAEPVKHFFKKADALAPEFLEQFPDMAVPLRVTNAEREEEKINIKLVSVKQDLYQDDPKHEGKTRPHVIAICHLARFTYLGITAAAVLREFDGMPAAVTVRHVGNDRFAPACAVSRKLLALMQGRTVFWPAHLYALHATAGWKIHYID